MKTIQKDTDFRQYEMASLAYDHAKTIENSGTIGQAFLMSTRDEFFLFDIQVIQARLFLLQSGVPDPKSIIYNLDTSFVVT